MKLLPLFLAILLLCNLALGANGAEYEYQSEDANMYHSSRSKTPIEQCSQTVRVRTLKQKAKEVPAAKEIDAVVDETAGDDNAGAEQSVLNFVDPVTKNSTDLVAYAIYAWESGWGYVWGTYGDVLTESLLGYKLRQYPDHVSGCEDFIRANWLGERTTDCVGLIKGYGWLDPDTLAIGYGTNGMPDCSANQMYLSASVSGTIDTIPDIPGLAVWRDGHIGVYIGNGEVIEARSTMLGVVRTQLNERDFTHWLKIEYINYD